MITSPLVNTFKTVFFAFIFFFLRNATCILPKTNTAMSDLDILLATLEAGEDAFSYAHFNDGELKALTCSKGEFTARRKQPCHPELNRAMKSALTNRAPNFYVGILCPCSWDADSYLKLMKILDVSDPWYAQNPTKCSPVPTKRIFADKILENRLTPGNLFVAANFQYAKQELARILHKAATVQGRGVHVFTGSGHGMKKEVNVSALPFPVASHHSTAHFDAFQHSYKRMRPKEFLIDAGVKSKDVVLLMIGPLGRILASEWAHLHPNITILNLGSLWNEELYGSVVGKVTDLDLQLPCMYQTDMNYTQKYDNTTMLI